jgi:integrase/recombinase XerD
LRTITSVPAAVHRLEAGVEVDVIRSWLGHISLDTTNRYAELTLRAKAEALRVCKVSSELSAASRARAAWKEPNVRGPPPKTIEPSPATT